MNFKMHNSKEFICFLFMLHMHIIVIKKTHEEKDVPQDPPIINIRIVRIVLRQL